MKSQKWHAGGSSGYLAKQPKLWPLGLFQRRSLSWSLSPRTRWTRCKVQANNTKSILSISRLLPHTLAPGWDKESHCAYRRNSTLSRRLSLLFCHNRRSGITTCLKLTLVRACSLNHGKSVTRSHVRAFTQCRQRPQGLASMGGSWPGMPFRDRTHETDLK